MMAKQAGEISLRKAAALVGVRVKTVRAWARRAWDGDPTQLAYGRKDTTGAWFVKHAEIERVIAERKEREERIKTQKIRDPMAAA